MNRQIHYCNVLSIPSISTSRNEFQSLPDYIRWLKHVTYIICHTERRVLLQHGPWDEVPGIFLPTRVLDLYY